MIISLLKMTAELFYHRFLSSYHSNRYRHLHYRHRHHHPQYYQGLKVIIHFFIKKTEYFNSQIPLQILKKIYKNVKMYQRLLKYCSLIAIKS